MIHRTNAFEKLAVLLVGVFLGYSGGLGGVRWGAVPVCVRKSAEDVGDSVPQGRGEQSSQLPAVL